MTKTPVIYQIIEIPPHLEIKQSECRIAWQVMEEIPSLKFSETPTTSDEEFECREVCSGRAVSDNSQDDLQNEKTVEEDNFDDKEEEDEKSEDLFSVDEQISYSDIIFSVPRQIHESKEGDQTKSHEEEGENYDKETCLQSMLLDNYVMEDKRPKKCLSRKRIRKSLSTETKT